MQQITANVYVETKRVGANTGFVTTTEGVVMIDTPHRPSDALGWRDEIARRDQVRYIINTEHHIDHITGNHFFPGIILSHAETRKAIENISLEIIREGVRAIAPNDMPLMEGYRVRVPTITFSEWLSLYLGDHTFDLIHIPGHTTGQIAVHMPKERLVFTGDTVSYKIQLWLHESDPFQWLASLKKIEEMDVDIIVPAHGEVCDKSYIPELASFIQEWVDAVREAIAQGLGKEEAMDRISFLDRYPMDVGLEARGPEVQRWNVGRLYDLLTK